MFGDPANLSDAYNQAHHSVLGGFVIKAEPCVPANLEPGKILAADECGVLIKAGIGGIRLREIEPRVTLEIASYL